MMIFNSLSRSLWIQRIEQQNVSLIRLLHGKKVDKTKNFVEWKQNKLKSYNRTNGMAADDSCILDPTYK